MLSPNGKWARHNFSCHLYFPASEWVSLPAHEPVDPAKSILKNLKEDPFGKQVSFFKVTTEDGITLDGWIAKPKDFDPSKKYPVFFYAVSYTHLDVYKRQAIVLKIGVIRLR